MKLIHAAPQVRHLIAPNRYELNSTFMRLQEFYESPNPKFRGKAFTHEQYMDWYAYCDDKPTDHDAATFSYFEDWSGFNVPGNVVCKFFQSDAFWLDMWKKERKLWELLAPTVSRHGESFYLIGTFAEDSGDISRKDVGEIVAHEIAHSLWYLSPVYRKITKLFDRIPIDFVILKTFLLTSFRPIFPPTPTTASMIGSMATPKSPATSTAGSLPATNIIGPSGKPRNIN